MINKKQSLILLSTAAIAAVLFNSCGSVKSNVNAVKPFNKEKYLGDWYEIARLDFKWEKNMSQVTAKYTSNEDGSIRVENKGFNYVKDEWKTSVGKAKFNGAMDQGALKVSFFGPFYSGYNVVKIDKDYKYALVFGENLKYLWILSREKTIPTKVKEEYLAYAEASGYQTSNLVWTKQTK
ncbi:lipocalin family protein [Sphingobacteriaceae bacterium WQ 2009]|uniref:Lipocalin family protein n=1 Tax=Rhinopithecimicrobium faecis TaxID=2820698 RepID=A0A8T4H762_9SPHI|nr:lipocalin family protein [Sphingobacteriaceae bacterium WQ 2009]